MLFPNLMIRIRGAANLLPAGRDWTNEDLLRLAPEAVDWSPKHFEIAARRIRDDFGFQKRRYANGGPGGTGVEGPNSEELATACARACLESAAGPTSAERPPGAPDLLLHGTTTSARYSGSQATAILGHLGLSLPAYEMKAGCSTSLALLHLAARLLRAPGESALIVAAETLSKIIDPREPSHWVGLADGAAALWLEAASERDADFVIEKSFYSTDGRYVDLFTTPGRLPPSARVIAEGGYFMSGDSERMKAVAREHYLGLFETFFTPTEKQSLRWIVPHLANRTLIEETKTAAGLAGEVLWCGEECANIGGASVLYGLNHFTRARAFAPGDRVLFCSVGGGLSFAAQLWRKL